MNTKGVKVGDIVKSTQNDFGVLYRVVKTLKTVCWVQTVEGHTEMHGGKRNVVFQTYKNIRYRYIEKVKQDAFGKELEIPEEERT